jgi:hypothetical protein
MKDPRLSTLETALGELFRREPGLCGFSIHEMRVSPMPEVVFDDIAIQPWAGYKPSPELVNEIAGTLLDAVEDFPEARQLLNGRTFASTIH